MSVLPSKYSTHAVRWVVEQIPLKITMSRDSVGYVFRDKLGDPTADAILQALRNSDGLTRTQIRDLQGRHGSSEETNRALAALAAQGLASVQHVPTGGRNEEMWTATKATKAPTNASSPGPHERDSSLWSHLSQTSDADDVRSALLPEASGFDWPDKGELSL